MKTLFTLLMLHCAAVSAFAQTPADWNYDRYPELHFDINHLELSFTVEPENALIKGTGKYYITSRRPDLTELVFHTADLEIQSITADEKPLNFHISSDSLIITLPDTLSQNREVNFTITWQSDSKYAIFKDAHGNIRTSLNPKKIRHWLPIYDHPRIEATIDASFTIPANLTAVFNGSQIRDEILSANEKQVEWSSEEALPVTGLTLALGSFTNSNALAGTKRITVYADETRLLPEVRKGLLEIAVNTVKNLERKLSFEFPFEALNVVVLPDHQWDEIQSGAGVIYLYQSLGNLATQLRRGIASQWFGSYHRYPDTIENAANYEFLKAVLLSENNFAELNNPDSLESISAWNFWANSSASQMNDFLKSTIEQSLPELVRSKAGVMSWNNYADFWYDKTGYFIQNLDISTQDSAQPEKSAVLYNVDYDYDELNSVLNLTFSAQNGAGLPTLADIELSEFGFSDTSRQTISITGTEDEVEVELSAGVEFVTLQPKKDSNIKLNEQKPFLFLVNQLRSPDPEDRLNAAAGLQNFSDNPDIQLALIDAMNREEVPKVKAAMLETMAMVFNGSNGTEQTFLSELRSPNAAVQKAAIEALSQYPGNENVANTLRNFILRSDADSLFATALQSYQEITGEEELLSLAQRLKELNSFGEKRLAILTAAATDTSAQILAEIEELTGEQFPYSIRKEAIEALINHQKDAEVWQELLPELFSSRDPRIRFLALDALHLLDDEYAENMRLNLQKEEFDPRILAKINENIM